MNYLEADSTFVETPSTIAQSSSTSLTLPSSLSSLSSSTPDDSHTINLKNLDLKKEKDRLLTFRHWRLEFLDAVLLAAIGFYYLGRTDKVKCFFCNLAINKWEPNDNPITEHLKYSPACPLLKRRTTLNVPIDENKLNSILPPVYSDTCGTGAIRSDSALMKYPDYQHVPTRSRTFDSWPPALKQQPVQLADAGFFYSGNGDKVICFCCGTGLKDWEEDDNVMEEHARHSSECAYLIFLKGENYCQEIKNKYNSHDSVLPKITPVAPVVNEIDQMDVEKDKPCKICYLNPAELVFIPCGHVATCKQCGFSMTKCPVCRENIKEKLKVFF